MLTLHWNVYKNLYGETPWTNHKQYRQSWAQSTHGLLLIPWSPNMDYVDTELDWEIISWIAFPVNIIFESATT